MTLTPTIDQMLGRLKNELLRGRAAVGIATGLLAADPVVFQAAPVFFGLTSDSLLELSQMYAAKLYDTHRGTITVPLLLSALELEENHALLKRGRREDVLDAVTTCRARIVALEKPLASVKTRRNKALAHLDPVFVSDPQTLDKTAKLTIDDLSRVFDETEKVLNKIDTLFSEAVGELRYLGQDDYIAVLDLIADAKCAEAAQYEKESGERWLWPLPKKCQKTSD